MKGNLIDQEEPTSLKAPSRICVTVIDEELGSHGNPSIQEAPDMAPSKGEARNNSQPQQSTIRHEGGSSHSSDHAIEVEDEELGSDGNPSILEAPTMAPSRGEAGEKSKQKQSTIGSDGGSNHSSDIEAPDEELGSDGYPKIREAPNMAPSRGEAGEKSKQKQSTIGSDGGSNHSSDHGIEAPDEELGSDGNPRIRETPNMAPSRGEVRQESKQKLNTIRNEGGSNHSDHATATRAAVSSDRSKLRLSDNEAKTSSSSEDAAMATAANENDDGSEETKGHRHSTESRHGVQEVGFYNVLIPSPGAVHVPGMNAENPPSSNAPMIVDEEEAVVAAEIAPDREMEVEEAYNQGAQDRARALQEAERLRRQVEQLQQTGSDVEVAVAVMDKDDGRGAQDPKWRMILFFMASLVLVGLVIGFVMEGGDGNNSPPEGSLEATSPPSVPEDLLPKLTQSFDFPMGLCQGDCDSDIHCQEGLRCFQRTGGMEVPGCSGGLKDLSASDYCITVTETFPPLEEVDDFPLGICQGDCDSNSHCEEGLICFQRNGGEEVPGCFGGSDDASNNDYCIKQGQFVESFGERLTGFPDDNFGTSVSVSSDGGIMAVGAVDLGSTGYVNIYESVDESSWNLVATIVGDHIGDRFGQTVEVSGDGRRVAILFVIGLGKSNSGGCCDYPSYSVRIRVFEASSDDRSVWNVVAGDMGYVYESWLNSYSFSLSFDGKILALGQPRDSSSDGTVVLYRNEYDNWARIASPDPEQRLDTTVSLSKNNETLRVAVSNPGSVRVFELNDDDTWLQIGQHLRDHDRNTVSLSRDGTVLALTASDRGFLCSYFKNDEMCDDTSYTYHVRMYKFNPATNWTELGAPIAVAGDIPPHISLSNDGEVIALGEPVFDNVGRVRLFQYYKASNEWTLLDESVRGRNFDERFGAALSLGGSTENITMAVGAPFDSSVSGARGSVTSYRTRLGEKPPIAEEPTMSPTVTPDVFETIDVWKGMGWTGGTDERMIGHSVSLSSDGSVLAFGALGSRLVGIVNIYKLGVTGWQSIGRIPGDEVSADFGHATALSGNGRILAVGSPKSKNGTEANHGRVQVFAYNETSNVWSQIGLDLVADEKPHLACNGTDWPSGTSNWDDDELDCNNDIVWSAIPPEFGHSVSLSEDGSILAVGAPAAYGGGITDVYRLENGQWGRLGNSIIGLSKLAGRAGWAVSISSDGMRLAVGANTNEQNWDESGAGRIYELIDDTWQLLGQELLGEDRHDLFGSSISLSGDGNVVAIGSVNNDNAGGENAGHVRVYSYNQETNWTLIGKPIIGKANGDRCGSAVSLNRDGTKIAVGANLGAYVRVYEYDADNTYWREVGAEVEGRARGNGFGASVALADVAGKMTLAVGAPLATVLLGLGQSVAVAGEVYVFEEVSSA